MSCFESDNYEAIFLYEEISRVLEKEHYIEDWSSGVDEGGWELMVLEGTSPALRVAEVGEGE